MRPLARTVAALAALLLAACQGGATPTEVRTDDPMARATVGDPGRAVSSDLLTAEPIAGGVRLRNRTSSPVFYFASERGALALVLWAPCTSAQQCTPVPPNGALDVPDAEIVGQAATAREIAVLHWRARVVAGRAQPDSVRAVVVVR